MSNIILNVNLISKKNSHLELDERFDELKEGGDLLVDHLGDDSLKSHPHARHRQIFLHGSEKHPLK